MSGKSAKAAERPPTMQERAEAAKAARAIKAALADPAKRGERSVLHVDLARPRRGLWVERWAGIPGFVRTNGRAYSHDLLPGWEYTAAEVRAELIPDLEALAEKGVRPKVATRARAA